MTRRRSAQEAPQSTPNVDFVDDTAFVGCTIKQLAPEHQASAATIAKVINPANAPSLNFLDALSLDDESPGGIMPPARLSILTNKYWGSKGVDLSVSFMDAPNAETKRLILLYANEWGKYGNVRFRETTGVGDVRIARENDGYWSYLGTDVKSIPSNQATMNLQGFTERTSLAEYERVVIHEFGHTLGCPHEHARPEIVELLDEALVIAYFKRTQGWNERTVRAQILTSLNESTLMGSRPEVGSIMCYDFPGSVTKNRKAIIGGTKLTVTDQSFIATAYPKAPGGGGGGGGGSASTFDCVVTTADGAKYSGKLTKIG